MKRSDSPEADRALGLWTRYQAARGALGRQRRSMRRAYGRVRDHALPAWTPFKPVS